jgi:hypothetical protein
MEGYGIKKRIGDIFDYIPYPQHRIMKEWAVKAGLESLLELTGICNYRERPKDAKSV